MSFLNKISISNSLVLFVPAILLLGSFRNPPGADESAVKAMFIYNFSKYFNWGDINSKTEFIIGVYGNTSATENLNEISRRKQINGKAIVIKKVYSVADLTDVQMLFIAGNNSKFIHEVNNVIPSGKLVLITENPGATKYLSHINLVNINDKLGFELNESLLKDQNIRFSKELSSLAFKKY